jgi:hypothetical protein
MMPANAAPRVCLRDTLAWPSLAIRGARILPRKLPRGALARYSAPMLTRP